MKSSAARQFPPRSIRPFLLVFILLNGTFLQAQTSPFSWVNESDMDRAETGLVLFDQAISRYWSSEGTSMGTLGLLDRAEWVYEYISDPAARYYLMAQVEYYRGLITLETDRRRRARPHFEESMNLAERSLTYRESSDTYRILADAAWEWLYSRHFRGDGKVFPKMDEWLNRSLFFNPANVSAVIVRARMEIKTADGDAGILEATYRELAGLRSDVELSPVEDFQICLLLHQLDGELAGEDEASAWCKEAGAIFPGNPSVADCTGDS